MTRAALEDLLVKTWQEVLGREVRPTDNFLALGGHSLLAIRMMGRIGHHLQRPLPMRMLLEAPTVRALAANLHRLLQTADEATAVPEPESATPLSTAQWHTWCREQAGEISAAANIAKVLRLQGPLDTAALEAALRSIVERHELLRTRIVGDAGGLRCALLDARAFACPVETVGGSSSAERLQHALAMAAEEARRPMRITDAPLVRARLLRIDREDHVLVITLHRLAADGFAIQVLTCELTAAYEAYRCGQRLQLPPLEVQYADFARSERRALQDGAYERQLAYWRELLATVPDATLPAAAPADVPTVQAPPIRSAVERRAAAALHVLARESGVTVFVVMLSLFQLAIGRLTGQRRFLLATPVTGRTRPELERLIANLGNVLPIAADLSDATTARELFARVRETCFEAFARQHVPFEEILRQRVPRGVAQVPPAFGLNNRRRGAALALHGIRVSATGHSELTLPNPVSLWVLVEQESIELVWRFREPRISRDTVTRLDATIRELIAETTRSDFTLDSPFIPRAVASGT